MVNKYAQFSGGGSEDEDLPFRVAFGSLWWVRDSTWVRHAKWYPGEARIGHPGLCAKETSNGLTHIWEPVYLLMGTTKRHAKSIFIAGVSEEQGAHFSFRKGAAIPGSEFRYAMRAKKGAIWKNRYKPELTEDEKVELRRMMRTKR